MTNKRLMPTAACVLAITAMASVAQAQDKPAPAQATTDPRAPGTLTPLRVQFVVSRFVGEKKIGSLPYTLWVTANESNRTRVRMGVEVPVPTTVFTGGSDKNVPLRSYNYRSVGTNIDCSASSGPSGTYKLFIVLSDSSIQFDPKDASRPSATTVADAPAFRNFSSEFTILLRDGQSAQYSSATDPVSGEVLKVDVTLNVLK